MQSSATDIEKIIYYFSAYCKEKEYQITTCDIQHAKKIEISNLHEKTIVVIYHKSNKIIQNGKKNELYHEIETLIADYYEQVKSIENHETKKQLTTKYNILMLDARKNIKEHLNEIGDKVSFNHIANPTTDYNVKIIRKDCSVTVTQYKNGTLFLQGKSSSLFNDCCDFIEKAANSTKNEIIERFIPDKDISHKISEINLPYSENIIKCKVGDVYEYLDTHDRDLFIVSECLCSLELEMPEYSYIVMPAAKAFEGFTKKISVSLGLVDKDHFKKKGASFSFLNNKSEHKKNVCDQLKYASTMLNKLSLGLDEYRNFVMHSDDEKITKVNTKEEAIKKVNNILESTKTIFDYFNQGIGLL